MASNNNGPVILLHDQNLAKLGHDAGGRPNLAEAVSVEFAGFG